MPDEPKKSEKSDSEAPESQTPEEIENERKRVRDKYSCNSKVRTFGDAD